jgi:AraC family transcriptional activator of pobA
LPHTKGVLLHAEEAVMIVSNVIVVHMIYPLNPISVESAHGDADEIPGQFIFVDMDFEALDSLNRRNPEMHRHAYHEIIWIRNGFPKHSLVSIPEGRIHTLYPSRDCKVSVIRFRAELLESTSNLIFSKFKYNTVIQATIEQAAIIESYLWLLCYESGQADHYSLNKFQHLLATFILKIEELRLLQSPLKAYDFKKSEFIWDRFNTLLEEKFQTEHSVSYYSRKMGISARKLCEINRLHTGKYVSEVIMERVITEAKRMILVTDLSLKEIAFQLGFDAQSYFTKVFKKHTGITPTKFNPADLTH